MKLTYFNQDQALAYLAERPERFPYQMVWRLSSVELGAARIPGNERADVTEARFFGPEAELRFYLEHGALAATLAEDEPGDAAIQREVRLLPKFGRTLKQLQYIAFDQDGQGYVALTRLAAWEGGGGDAG